MPERERNGKRDILIFILVIEPHVKSNYDESVSL